MTKIKILTTKKFDQEKSELPKEKRRVIENYLDVLSKTSNPSSFGHNTLSSKIGDILFHLQDLTLIGLVKNDHIYISKLLA